MQHRDTRNTCYRYPLIKFLLHTKPPPTPMIASSAQTRARAGPPNRSSSCPASTARTKMATYGGIAPRRKSKNTNVKTLDRDRASRVFPAVLASHHNPSNGVLDSPRTKAPIGNADPDPCQMHCGHMMSGNMWCKKNIGSLSNKIMYLSGHDSDVDNMWIACKHPLLKLYAQHRAEKRAQPSPAQRRRFSVGNPPQALSPPGFIVQEATGWLRRCALG